MKYCYKNKNKNYEIYIWKYDKNKNIKKAYCCASCTIIAKKYNYRIYTLDDNYNVTSAIIDNPQKTLYYQIKNKDF